MNSSMSRSGRWALGLVACLALACGLSACRTDIAFRNDIPNASIENVEWITDDGTVYSSSSDDRLEPGQVAKPVTIPEQHNGDTGRIQFELVVEGRKVALVTDRSFKARSGEETVFSISPSTVARNRLTP